jgi:hypothetical protein
VGDQLCEGEVVIFYDTDAAIGDGSTTKGSETAKK